MLQQFSVYWLLIFKVVYVKKKWACFYFQWSSQRQAHAVHEGPRGDNVKVAHDMFLRCLGTSDCLAVAVAVSRRLEARDGFMASAAVGR